MCSAVSVLQWSKLRAIELPPQAMMVDPAPLPAPPPPAPPSGDTATTPGAKSCRYLVLVEAPKRRFLYPNRPGRVKSSTAQAWGKTGPGQRRNLQKRNRATQSPTKNTSEIAAPAPGAVGATTGGQGRWEGTLPGSLGKYKKAPPAAQSRGKEGLNRLRFVVDAEGKRYCLTNW